MAEGKAHKNAVRPQAMAEQFVKSVVLTTSLSLGVIEASTIASQVHFLKYVGAFTAIIVFTFYMQSRIQTLAKSYDGLFVLVWQIASRLVSFVQQFLTTLTLNVVILKLRENETEASSVPLLSKYLIYFTIFLLLSTASVLFSWYFYEDDNEGGVPSLVLSRLLGTTPSLSQNNGSEHRSKQS